MKPKVSVIIITYNREKLLAQAIDSVLAQTFSDWELLIIDDGSTDETHRVIDAYQQKCKKICSISQPNQGLPKTRAKSVFMSEGEYLAYLDDDDRFVPEKLQKQVDFMEKNRNVALVYGYVDVIRENGDYEQRLPKIPAHNFQELFEQSVIVPSAALIRKSVFTKLGTFRTDLKTCDDYEMFLRISRQYSIHFLPETMTFYGRHAGNMTNNAYQILSDEMKIRKDLLRWELTPLERSKVKEALRQGALQFYRMAVKASDENNPTLAAAAYREALRYDPFVGAHITWGRFNHSVYKVSRPYAAALYYGFKSGTFRKESSRSCLR